MNPMEEFFTELAERYAGDLTTCDECGQDFPDEKMNSDLAVKRGAPLCDDCFAKLDGLSAEKLTP